MARDYSAGHAFQGGPQGLGAGALGDQAWGSGWQTAQPLGLSMDVYLSGLNQEFQRRYNCAGPSGVGAPGRVLRPDWVGAELATRLGSDGGGSPWGSQLGAGSSGAGSLGMLLRPVPGGAGISSRPGADGGGLIWGSQLGAGSSAAGYPQAGVPEVFPRPDSRGAPPATRQSVTCPRAVSGKVRPLPGQGQMEEDSSGDHSVGLDQVEQGRRVCSSGQT